MGALGAFVLTAAYGRLNWKVTKTSIIVATKIAAMLFAIYIGAIVFGEILAFSGVSRGLVGWISGLSLTPLSIIVSMMVLVLILGCFMDGLTLSLVLIPISMPIIYALGFNPIWFVIVFLLNTEMGLTTPPFGMILFVVKGTAPPGTTMNDLYRAALPFLACDAIAMALMFAFPSIVLWLPSIMITH